MGPEKTKVILADDHGIVRAGVRSVLSAQPDMQVVAEVSDGNAAVRATADNRPDVAVLDVSMPGLSGIAATEQILALNLGTKVIGLSAHSERQSIAAMLDAGACGYLVKNSAADELASAIRVVMGGGTYLSRQASEALEPNDPKAPERSLTQREREVLRMIADGKSSKEIADEMFLSPRTVEAYRAKIMDKLEIRTIAGLTRYALRHGLSATD